ncbi:GNAT family N-acetyltransferase [Sphingomonas sp. NIBR02145]|uniref:GNAT family N-acetyltransferase n=1 Tax=Sphingomonas sp. NIBR02145 TaxID=3014784 RepID=UPI0022B35091|nr:GNAT family N-acetyltransferase [Sphingomonas sp. NIBR02145]WHU03860.1 GNAT family N-acetyltransferase [Sphingomonas sp. NIBR02145]
MIETSRLILRRWQDSDRPAWHAMGRDPAVMEFLGPPLSAEDADAAMARQNALLGAHGYCFWAIERKEDGAFLGFCGLKPGPEGTPLFGQVEIGWRLAATGWGKGYAREAAQASLDWAWANLDTPQVAAMTVLGNTRSWGLMERLGMTRAQDEDFIHPNAPDWLNPHITYRIARPAD